MAVSGRKWRAVAARLAQQLASHAVCERHGEAASDPECPFCEDRAAYKTWLTAGGQDFRLAALAAADQRSVQIIGKAREALALPEE